MKLLVMFLNSYAYQAVALPAVLMIIALMASNLMKMKFGSSDWLLQLHGRELFKRSVLILIAIFWHLLPMLYVAKLLHVSHSFYFPTIPSFLNFLSPHKKVSYLHLAIVISFNYFLIQFYVCGFPNDTPQRVRKYAVGRTRYSIRSLTAYFSRIAVGDNRDGILFFSYHEVSGDDCLYCKDWRAIL
jgi:hypothetical protein